MQKEKEKGKEKKKENKQQQPIRANLLHHDCSRCSPCSRSQPAGSPASRPAGCPHPPRLSRSSTHRHVCHGLRIRPGFALSTRTWQWRLLDARSRGRVQEPAAAATGAAGSVDQMVQRDDDMAGGTGRGGVDVRRAYAGGCKLDSLVCLCLSASLPVCVSGHRRCMGPIQFQSNSNKKYINPSLFLLAVGSFSLTPGLARSSEAFAPPFFDLCCLAWLRRFRGWGASDSCSAGFPRPHRLPCFSADDTGLSGLSGRRAGLNERIGSLHDLAGDDACTWRPALAGSQPSLWVSTADDAQREV